MAEQDAEDTTPATPDEPDAGLGGRLPLLDPQDLTRARRGVFDRLVASRVPEAARAGFTAQLTDGRFVGPFNSFLYSPQIAGGLLDWADAQVNHSALAADVRQAIILTVGAEWEAEFELYAHTAGARKPESPTRPSTQSKRGSGRTDSRPKRTWRTGSRTPWSGLTP